MLNSKGGNKQRRAAVVFGCHFILQQCIASGSRSRDLILIVCKQEATLPAQPRLPPGLWVATCNNNDNSASGYMCRVLASQKISSPLQKEHTSSTAPSRPAPTELADGTAPEIEPAGQHPWTASTSRMRKLL
jgi:hypothetical protein